MTSLADPRRAIEAERSGTRIECAHCRLPVPAGLADVAAEHQFCCEGCRAVWTTLHACGLERYYELAAREAEESETRPAQVTGRRYAHLDRPEFAARHVRIDADGRAGAEFRLDGLRCGACVWLIEALPRIVPGLLVLRVDLGRSALHVEWDPDRIGLGSIARRLDGLGYQLLPLANPNERELDRLNDRRWLIRLGVAAAIASNAMAVAFAIYGGILAPMELGYRLFFQWIAVLLAVLSLAWPGRVFFVNAWTALRTRTPHMDLPVAVGLAAMLVSGLVNTMRGTGSIYGESATTLVFLLLVGRFVQYRQQRKARQEIELITALVPAVARRLMADGSIEEIPIDALRSGDLVQVPAGESVPCDGVLRGEAGSARTTRFDLALLTGESMPVGVSAGEPVFAGTRPLDRPIEVEVTSTGAETRAGRIAALVAEASSRRPPIVELVNRIGGWFLATVLLFAFGTAWFWWGRIGGEAALERAVALLVVTCPCALGLATPLAIMSGIGKAARRGIFIKGGDVLERIAHARSVVLDKTGTITEGSVALLERHGDDQAIRLAAALERSSAHPIATALVAAIDAGEFPAASDVTERSGHGIAGSILGRRVAVGSQRFMGEVDAVLPEWAMECARGALTNVRSPVFVAVDGTVAAVVAVGDPIRPEAKGIIKALRGRGHAVAMASGDHPAVARAVARAVGLPEDCCAGGLTPEAKVDFVLESRRAGPVIMVGDGVNDLAAMAAADVGVAVRNGAQAALAVADVCLAAGGVRPLADLVAGARRTMTTIRLNLAISIGYNALGATLAFAGLVNPLVAAILMPVSGLTVTAIALTMPRFDAAPRSVSR